MIALCHTTTLRSPDSRGTLHAHLANLTRSSSHVDLSLQGSISDPNADDTCSVFFLQQCQQHPKTHCTSRIIANV